MSFELDRIEELCRDRGWSRYRLAKEMNVSPNSIGNLFRRTSVPSVPTLRHICRALGITISQFYGTDGLTGDKQKVEGYIEGLLAKDGESGL